MRNVKIVVNQVMECLIVKNAGQTESIKVIVPNALKEE